MCSFASEHGFGESPKRQSSIKKDARLHPNRVQSVSLSLSSVSCFKIDHTCTEIVVFECVRGKFARCLRMAKGLFLWKRHSRDLKKVKTFQSAP